MENFTITESMTSKGVKIVVIGVGGGGGNMINELANSDIAKEVKLIAANTDAQALEVCNAPHKIQIGPITTRGLGAGMDPEVGKAAALESYDEIKKALLS
ncbi:MAG: cell division protein FtsZ [Campylobacterota bacterium]|nr:cell division protein FtsZ [Campylobacterota bacterium]